MSEPHVHDWKCESGKKLRKVELVPLKEIPDVIQQMVDAVKHSPIASWNVVHWNKAIPDSAICFGYETETQAIRAYNTVTKMSSVLAACLRFQTEVKDSYVWML